MGRKSILGFGGEDNDGKNMNVIGIVKDHHSRGLDSKIPPTFFIHWNSFDWMKNNLQIIQFKIKPENIQETLKHVENYWKDNIEQGYPFSPGFINKRFARTYKRYQNQQTLFFILNNSSDNCLFVRFICFSYTNNSTKIKRSSYKKNFRCIYKRNYVSN